MADLTLGDFDGDSDLLARLCAIAEIDRPHDGIDDRNVFDNRLDGENPVPIVFSNPIEVRQIYFSQKFSYFAEKLNILFSNGVSGLSSPPGAEMPRALTSRWDVIFTSECKAYLLRTAQSAKSSVMRAWYNELDECVAWTELLDKLAAELGTSVLADRFNDEFPIQIETERDTAKRLERARNSLETASGLALIPSATVAGLLTAHAEEVRERLANQLREVFLDPESDFDECVRRTATVLAEAYGVRICDFLAVTHRDGSPRLELMASSYPADIEDVRRGEYSYEFAAGITGTAFLLTPDDPHRWVGTENLKRDPRAGPKHTKSFKQIYGDVSSFWVFPVFTGRTLAGVFRLIDLVPNGYSDQLGDSGRWPVVVRAEVANVADWFGSLFGLLRSALGGGHEDSLVSSIARARRHCASIGSSLLGWVPLPYMSSLLSQMTRLALMRTEHRTVGCLVAVGTTDACKEVLRFNKDEYSAIPPERRHGRLDEAADLFGRVLPGAGVFVCELPDDEGFDVQDVAYSRVLATNKLAPEDVIDEYRAISEFGLIFVNGDHDVLHLYEEGRQVADCFLNEKTGTWQLRVFELIEHLLGEIAPDGMSLQHASEAVRKVISFSYLGAGGLIVLRSSGVDKSVCSERGFQVEDWIARMDPKLFASVASVDGGTWIDTGSGRVVEAGILFKNDVDEDLVHTGGARHKAASYLWRTLNDSIVLAVSANKEITVFASGQSDPIALSVM